WVPRARRPSPVRPCLAKGGLGYPFGIPRLKESRRNRFVVHCFGPINLRDALFIEKMRNVHGGLNALELLVIPIRVLVFLPFVGVRVLHLVGDAKGQETALVEVNANAHLASIHDVEDESRSGIHKIYAAELDKVPR